MTAQSAARAQHATLTAATEDVVTFSKPNKGVEVINRSAAGYIYARFDNTAAVAEADETYVVPPGMTFAWPYPTSIVRLISATADAYSVQAVG